MTAHDKLIRMNACRAAVDWIGGRTIVHNVPAAAIERMRARWEDAAELLPR